MSIQDKFTEPNLRKKRNKHIEPDSSIVARIKAADAAITGALADITARMFDPDMPTAEFARDMVYATTLASASCVGVHVRHLYSHYDKMTKADVDELIEHLTDLFRQQTESYFINHRCELDEKD